MDLFSVSLRCFKRFSTKQTLRTNGKLVAVLGPNEGGKTSILHAILASNSDETIPNSEVTRGADADDLEIICTYLLNLDESSLASLPNPTWFSVHKYQSGQRRFSFKPPAPLRDTQPRRTAHQAMENFLQFVNANGQLFSAELFDSIKNSIAVLEKKSESLERADLSQLRNTRDELDSKRSHHIKEIDETFEILEGLIEAETKPTPFSTAAQELRGKLPSILLFSEDDRNLKTSYSVDELVSSPPAALAGLAEIADLSLAKLIPAMQNRALADINTIEHAANLRLSERWTEVWHQSGISVSLRISYDAIAIHIVDEKGQFTSIGERSDGLRQFVALQSFVMREGKSKPILLIDEAEQRLHYDAQADLVQMLAQQDAAPKVIYSTHSAGCLPEDLGNGVRLVSMNPSSQSESIIRNKFWDSNETGFAPLLFGMGASTLAFFPTRKSVMVEGPADMLLLPTLLRDALERERLGFQFVPGLANSASTITPLLPGQHGNIAYVVDGDDAGVAIRDALEGSEVPSNRILLLRSKDGSAIELEDFIDPNILLNAINGLLRDFYNGQIIELGEIGFLHRTKVIRQIYEFHTGVDVPKVELAYALLDYADANPNKSLLDSRRRNSFRTFATNLAELFESDG